MTNHNGRLRVLQTPRKNRRCASGNASRYGIDMVERAYARGRAYAPECTRVHTRIPPVGDIAARHADVSVLGSCPAVWYGACTRVYHGPATFHCSGRAPPRDQQTADERDSSDSVIWLRYYPGKCRITRHFTLNRIWVNGRQSLDQIADLY